jgi:DNA-binding NarL/FixJ family response regulator
LIKILLVDDHQAVRAGLRALLEAQHFDVCGEASDGERAIDCVLSLNPDVVLMDISMPVMNGFDATREIRRLAPKTKIVILSMHDTPAMEQAAIAVGADAYVVKTCRADELSKTIFRIWASTVVDRPGAYRDCEDCKTLVTAHRESVARLLIATKRVSDVAIGREYDLFQKIWNEAMEAFRQCAVRRKQVLLHFESHH